MLSLEMKPKMRYSDFVPIEAANYRDRMRGKFISVTKWNFRLELATIWQVGERPRLEKTNYSLEKSRRKKTKTNEFSVCLRTTEPVDFELETNKSGKADVNSSLSLYMCRTHVHVSVNERSTWWLEWGGGGILTT